MKPTIQFLGHSACIFTTSKLKMAIDPWLEANPMTPENLKNPSDLDLIVLTHGHADHASDTVRLQKITNCMVLATFELAMILIQEGIPQDNIIAMNKGGSTKFKDSTVTLTNAFHSSSYDSPTKGTLYAGEACGVVICSDNTTIYHAGDTCLFSDLEIIGSTYKPDLALVPIGGRFTMGSLDASKAVRLLNVKRAVPIHYKTFPVLEQSADDFISACHNFDVEVLALNPGESYQF